MEKRFCFIDGLQADEVSKKQSRRHVMVGKNAGKTVHRPSRHNKQHQQLQRYNSTEENRDDATQAASGSAAWLLPPNCQESLLPAQQWQGSSPRMLVVGFGNDMVSLALPVPVTHHALEVISDFFNHTADKVYPAQLGLSMQEAKLIWLRVLVSDDASYHCNLALMQACNEIFLGKGESSPKALYYLSQTFRQLNKRLQGRDALSNSTIAIVLALVNQEQIRQQHSAASVHVKGVERMVQLRGGLEALEGAPALVHKLCKTDIVLALQSGEPPRFFRDRFSDVRDRLSRQGLYMTRPNDACMISEHLWLDAGLFEVLMDAMSFCTLMNDKLGGMMLELASFHDIFISLGHRLLHFSSLKQARARLGGVQAVHHLGLCVFLMTVLVQHDQRRIMDFPKTPVYLQDAMEDGLDALGSEFSLWFLVMGGIWTTARASTAALVVPLRAVAEELGLQTWSDARKVLRKYPWLDGLHDEPGKKLWNGVFTSDGGVEERER